MQARRFVTTVAVALGSLLPVSVLAPIKASAAVSLTIRGTVVCGSSTEKVVGVWMESSGGGSQFASWKAYPGKPHVASYRATFTTNASPSIFLNVGCGGSTATWGRSVRTPTVKAKSDAKQVFLNARCATGATRCTTPPNKARANPSPDYNWFASNQCTHRAADFWKRMTNEYPQWQNSATDQRTGNAGFWDDNAAKDGWKIEGVPMPDSLIVWQPNKLGIGSAGHVGYVADVTVERGVLRMKVYDRNADNRGGKRDGVWIDFDPSMRFITAPPRSDSIAR